MNLLPILTLGALLFTLPHSATAQSHDLSPARKAEPTVTQEQKSIMEKTRVDRDDLEKDIPVLTRALAQDPDNPLFHYYLARLYAARACNHHWDIKREEIADVIQEKGEEKRAAEGIFTRREADAFAQTLAAIKTDEDAFYEHLSRAYQLQGKLAPGEHLPNPRLVRDFFDFSADPRFKEILAQAGAGARGDLKRDLQWLIKRENPIDEDDLPALIEDAASSPTFALNTLLEFLSRSGLTDQERRVYAGCLGCIHDPKATDALIRMWMDKSCESIHSDVASALGWTGNPRATQALLAGFRLDDILGIEAHPSPGFVPGSGKGDALFSLLALADLKDASALKAIEKTLHYDSSLIIGLSLFRRLGTAGDSMLLGKIDDADTSVRLHALGLIGALYVPVESKVLLARLPKENDPIVRLIIIENLLGRMPLDEYEALLKKHLAQETDARLRDSYEQSIRDLVGIMKDLPRCKARKKEDRTLFETEYARLYQSKGIIGSFDVLIDCSSVKDEPLLRRLYSRINAFDDNADTFKIDRLILCNRLLGL